VPDIFKAIILGIVQGLTEFLPVSSTGHLILMQELLGVSDDTFGLAFDAAIHLGTLAAVLVYFRDLILSLARAVLESVVERRWDYSPDSRLGWFLLLGTVPAGIAGLLLEDLVEDTFREPALVAVMLILFSFVMLAAERFGSGSREAGQVGAVDALIIGAAQAVALIPGVSRSGITISAGMMRGLQRSEAAVFAFLLSGPVIAAAGSSQLLDIIRGDASEDAGLGLVIVGMVTAGVVGYGAIAFLIRFLRGNPLDPFIAYRIVLGLVVLALVAVGVL
jgi:undecaprenyl-diphosphatase